MGETTPLPQEKHLLSRYAARRDADGRLLLRSASVRGPVLGCLVPTALVVVLGSLVAVVGNFPGMFGPPALALVFAAVAVPILIRQGMRAWILGPDSIQEATVIQTRERRAKAPRVARSVVLRREVWRRRRGLTGSTDTVYVVTDRDSRLTIARFFNWAGQESRLANGGAGSLARAAPSVPVAPEPLAVPANANLLSAVSEAVRELVELLRTELGVAVAYESGETLQGPR
jgi:hypothetical protein